MKSRTDKIVFAIKQFSEEASGIIYWTGFLMGFLMGLSISVFVLLYFNLKVMM